MLEGLDPKVHYIFSGFYAATVEMPDFYFHLTIAYAILRHNGIELGKPDFLAGGQ